jgi:hypothetical protein
MYWWMLQMELSVPAFDGAVNVLVWPSERGEQQCILGLRRRQARHGTREQMQIALSR